MYKIVIALRVLGKDSEMKLLVLFAPTSGAIGDVCMHQIHFIANDWLDASSPAETD